MSDGTKEEPLSDDGLREGLEALTSTGEEQAPEPGFVPRRKLGEFDTLSSFLREIIEFDKLEDADELAEFYGLDPESVRSVLDETAAVFDDDFVATLLSIPILEQKDRVNLLKIFKEQDNARRIERIAPEATLTTKAPPKDEPFYSREPAYPGQINVSAETRVVGYRLEVYDLLDVNQKDEYNALMTEWMRKTSSYKILDRKISFTDTDKSVMVEIQDLEFLNQKKG